MSVRNGVWRRSLGRCLAALWSSAVVIACVAPADGPPGERAERVGCEPGQMYACPCINGSNGMQVCADDGASLGTCTGCGMTEPGDTEYAPPLPPSQGAPSGSDVTDPVEPDPVEPEPVEPGPIEPDPIEPDPIEPDPIEPDPIEPGPIEPGSDLVPQTAHCAPVSAWDPLWVQWEEEVLLLVNEERALGANCGTGGTFGPAAPLSMDPALRCAARLHSLDMADRGFFDHVSPEGTDPGARINAAGYVAQGWAENIAAGQQSPQSVVDGWMDSDGHCANIMAGYLTEIGVGYYYTDGFTSMRHYWTQNFGVPWGG